VLRSTASHVSARKTHLVSIQIKTTGFASTLASLSGLDLDLQRKVIGAGLRKAGRAVVKKAKDNTRGDADSGLLGKSISVSVRVDRTGRGVAHIRPSGKRVKVMQTGPDGKRRLKTTRATAYAHIREYGSKYVSPKPYMRPAIETTTPQIEAAFSEGVATALAKLKS
jgi:HK97 gp10 family phage protein